MEAAITSTMRPQLGGAHCFKVHQPVQLQLLRKKLPLAVKESPWPDIKIVTSKSSPKLKMRYRSSVLPSILKMLAQYPFTHVDISWMWEWGGAKSLYRFGCSSTQCMPFHRIICLAVGLRRTLCRINNYSYSWLYHDTHRLILRSCSFHVCNIPSLQDKDAEQRYVCTRTDNIGKALSFSYMYVNAFRCQILSLQYYDEGALSILVHYSPKAEDEEDLSSSHAPGSAPLPHQAVAQLPIEDLVSLLPWDTVESHDPTESVDVGHILELICPLGPFRAGKLAVSGTRKLAAVVRGIACMSEIGWIFN